MICELGAWVGLGLSICSHPGPAIPVWDNAMDVMHCRRIQVISEPTSTAGGFGIAVEAMTGATLAVGGTDLLLRKNGHDWSVVTGVAYSCAGPARPQKVLSVKY